MNDHKMILSKSAAMIKVMILLSPHAAGASTLRKVCTYTQMMILNMLLTLHHQKNDNLWWKVFEINPCAFNEEAGETSFSVLSRCCLGDTMKSKFEHLNKMYQMLSMHRELNAEVHEETPIANYNNGHYRFKPNDAIVCATVEHFKLRIRQLVGKQFQYYDGTLSCFKSQAFAVRHLMSDPVNSVWKDNVSEDVKGTIQWLRNHMFVYFLQDHTQYWPEAKDCIPVDSNDESVSCSDEADVHLPDSSAEDEDPIMNSSQNSSNLSAPESPPPLSPEYLPRYHVPARVLPSIHEDDLCHENLNDDEMTQVAESLYDSNDSDVDIEPEFSFRESDISEGDDEKTHRSYTSYEEGFMADVNNIRSRRSVSGRFVYDHLQ
jgi:hypothetical protein